MLAPYVPYPFIGDAHSRKGGVERYVTEVARHMNCNGYDVTLIAPLENGNEVESEDDSVIYIPRMGTFCAAPVFSPHHLLRCVKDFDIIHTQGTFPILSDFNPILCKLKQVPSVITYHFDPSPPGLFGDLAARVYGGTLARFMRRHDRIIFSSRSYRASCRLMDRVSEERIRYIPMGVDSEYFTPNRSCTTTDNFLFVGRFVPYKNLPLLLKAMNLVRKFLPKHKLLLVGAGPLEPEIRALASRLGVNAEFLGKVDDEQLLSLYRSSVATVLASQDKQEAFGMVLAESMSCGTPVVAADIPGVCEVATEGGYTFEPGCADSMASAMVEAAETPHSYADRMSLHQRIMQKYSWHSIAEQTSAVYDEIL